MLPVNNVAVKKYLQDN